MKNLIMSIAVMIMAAGLITGCDSRSRTDSANKNTENSTYDNNRNTDVTNDVSGAEYRKFKLDAEDQIAEMDREIAQIRKKLATEEVENRDRLERRLERIEKKNTELKDELADFKEDAADKRDSFRKRFNDDLTKMRQDVNEFWTAKDDDMNDNRR